MELGPLWCEETTHATRLHLDYSVTPSPTRRSKLPDCCMVVSITRLCSSIGRDSKVQVVSWGGSDTGHERWSNDYTSFFIPLSSSSFSSVHNSSHYYS